MACGIRRGEKKLLVGEGKTVGVDKVPTKTEFDEAEHGSSVQDEAVKKLGDLNVLHMRTSFCLLTPSLLLERLHSIWSVLVTLKTWDRLQSKFEPNSAPSLLKLRNIFENSKLYSADKDPDI